MSTPNVPGAPRRGNFPPPPPKPARSPGAPGARTPGLLDRFRRSPSRGGPSRGGTPGTRREERRRRRRRGPLFLIAAVVAVGLIIWGIAALAGAGKPKAAVESTAYAKGDCFADFDAAATSGNKVDCAEAHSAQLVGVENAPADEAYPGRDALEQRASQLCKTSDITLPDDTSHLKQRSAYPSQDGWQGGDRRMDCYVVTTDGNTLTASLLH
ncbi:hypothetical protein SCMU_33880 [Sinomonas cyclohexanicum]|uniref:Septum formation-related domain-containing protein n=1 Tax=Sinomonas cyclohexanicum TaxID=322009 RepID=A0ABM7PZ15_SINCY|nr:hypothetical protein SCMU_33880 [Corynebacterium cyclohexanicum]